jgi:catechol 2,3-dioxygenase-like lactoylglutathione lyase family enzyme
MMHIDHLILRVSDTKISLRFYQQLLGLHYDGFAEPFEVLRINDGSTIDLLAAPPKDPVHLAFCIDREAFEEVRKRLQVMDIPFGGNPFSRDGRTLSQFGARGWADSLYFYDPDHHNIEVRSYDRH